jgi:hypothetical protein
MTRPWNVLVFPGGTEIGLEVWSALRACKEVVLFSAGQGLSSHASYVFPRYHPLPSVFEPDWIEPLNNLCIRLGIDFVIPAHDDVLVALASERERLAAQVVTSPAATCAIARYKSRTYAALKDSIPCPRVYTREQVAHLPVFCKPDRGQGSQDARWIRMAGELALVQPGEILLEPLPGAEFTVDCFSDRERGLLFARGRERIRVRNGISVATASAERPEFRRYAEAISAALPFHGAWFFQVKEAADGQLKLLEVAPRIAGGMAYYRVQGVNFPLLSLYETARLRFEILVNRDLGLEMDRALINRYRHKLRFGAVYIDLDDTLVFRGSVNLMLVTFLYQCVNSGIRIVLVTKHAAALEDCLSRCRLRQLFDEVVHLRRDQDKADAITRCDAIFIDDSFSERCAAHLRTGIPTFDLSMIEMLIDHTGPDFPFAPAKASKPAGIKLHLSSSETTSATA